MEFLRIHEAKELDWLKRQTAKKTYDKRGEGRLHRPNRNAAGLTEDQTLVILEQIGILLQECYERLEERGEEGRGSRIFYAESIGGRATMRCPTVVVHSRWEGQRQQSEDAVDELQSSWTAV